MNRPGYQDPVWQWIDQRIAGTISAEDAQRLEDRLASDPHARRLYLDYCRLHAELMLEARDSMASRVAMEQISAAQLGTLTCEAPSKTPKHDWRRTTLPWAIAAALLLAVTTWAFVASNGSRDSATVAVESNDDQSTTTPPTEPISDSPDNSIPDTIDPPADNTPQIAENQPNTGNSAAAGDSAPDTIAGTGDTPTTHDSLATDDESSKPVASIANIRDARWAAGAQEFVEGDTLLPGSRLAIEQGWIELHLAAGGKVDLVGPAELVVESPSACRLEAGKVSANISNQASGFAVRTEKNEIVSLTADFSMQVKDNREVSVHVHSGEVVFWNPGGTSKEVHVLAGNSVVASPRRTSLDYGIASTTRFAGPTNNNLASAAAPTATLPITRNLALWLTAESRMVTDDEGHILAWPDRAANDGDTNEDAWQHEPEARPTLVEDGIGHRPSVHFDGENDYITTEPLLSTPDQTLFFVFRSASDFAPPTTHGESVKTSRQLINYNGPVHQPNTPRREPHQIHSLQICDRLFPGMYWGRVYATPPSSSNGGLHLGSVATRRLVQVDEAVVLTYAYHPSRNRAGIFINGELQGVDTAPLGRAYVSQKVIGRSPAYPAFFHGDMAEILIYNQALNGDQLNQVSRYLGQKFSIEVSAKVEDLADHHPQQVKVRQREDVGPLVHWRDSKD
ncbi:LamG domain-containing protein [Aeoliella mucimassa]|uniref:FecR protein n=1 Tax=Aeoliella mucimassa TaxID=2527972 RepID=A0A518AK27_9BACT|nr:LamG domain-containing protein [Aeoliella mucimassa]QDU55078.1 FecR protein [Aeoliella mucimassa]